MKSIAKTLLLSALLLGVVGRSEARPVRVLFLKFVYTGGFIYSSIKNGTPHIESMLADPAGLTGNKSLVNSEVGTGDGIRVPVDGFRVDTIGNGSYATAANIAKFVSLLDSIDVLVLANTIGFGGILQSDSDRAKFLDFAATKGIVAWGGTNDAHSVTSSAPTWTAYDSLCGGALVKDWVNTPPPVNVLQDSLPFNLTDSTFQVLKRGLLPQYRFVEAWKSFTQNPRNVPGMHVLYTVNEADYTPQTRMGDHPISWYRYSLSGKGGRYFYTGMGHVDTLFLQNYFLRRQIYNAIVWAAKVDGNGAVAVRTVKTREMKTGVFRAAVTGSMLVVTPLEVGDYRVTVRALDGRRMGVAEAKDGQPTTLSFRPHALYSITVESAGSRRSELVAVP